MRLYMLDSRALTEADMESVRRRFPARFARACRMRREEDRRSVIGSGLLLHRALGVEEEASLRRTPAGRPYLEQGPVFSLSHSAGRCFGQMTCGSGRRSITSRQRSSFSPSPVSITS